MQEETADSNSSDILLKRNWDFTMRIGEKSIPHIKRTVEHQTLLDFMTRRSVGSMLLSGKRGVGKTSLVLAALNDAINFLTQSKKQVIAPVLDATSLDLPGDSPLSPDDPRPSIELKLSVLKYLVRRLYKSSKVLGSKIKKEDFDKISLLYERAVAKEIKKEVGSRLAVKDELIIERESTRKLTLVFDKLSILALSALAAVIYVLKPFTGQTFVDLAIPLAIVIVPNVVLGVLWRESKIKKKEDVKLSSSDELYKYDYDLTNLEAELDEVLEKISAVNQIIFIFDELDKVPFDLVLKIIAGLKTLFNQSHAQFIILTAPDVYESLRLEGGVSKNYTLFPQKIFLTRPKFSELRDFLKNIVESPRIITEDVKFGMFSKYACYMSRNNFFELYEVIRDHIIGYNKDNQPILDIKLNIKQELFANLQIVLEDIYSLRRDQRISKWHQNEILLDKLYELLDRLSSLKEDTKFSLQKVPHLKITLNTEDIENVILEVTDPYISDSLLYLITRLRREYFLYYWDKYLQINGKLANIIGPNYRQDKETKLIETYDKFKVLALVYGKWAYDIYGGTFYGEESLGYPSIWELIKKMIHWEDDPFWGLQNIIPLYENTKSVLGEPFSDKEFESAVFQLKDWTNDLIIEFIPALNKLIDSRFPWARENIIDLSWIYEIKPSEACPSTLVHIPTQHRHQIDILFIFNASLQVIEELMLQENLFLVAVNSLENNIRDQISHSKSSVNIFIDNLSKAINDVNFDSHDRFTYIELPDEIELMDKLGANLSFFLQG